MNRLQLCRLAALACYFGLLILLVAWYGWIAPPQDVPRAVALLLGGLPLLLLLRGLLRARILAHVWVSMLALLYLAHAVIEAYSNPPVRRLAAMEMILAVLLTASAAWYVRLRARAAGRHSG